MLAGGGRSWLGGVLAGHELAAQEFSHRRFRNFGDEDIAARALVAGKAGAAAERVKLVGLDGVTAFDERGDDLAPALVGKLLRRKLVAGEYEPASSLEGTAA